MRFVSGKPTWRPMSELVPLSVVALELRLSRERALRRVLSGELEGELRAGRWYVVRASLDQAIAGKLTASP